MQYNVGIDIGGTFVDLVALNLETGEIHCHKTPSVPANLSQGVINVLKKAVAEGNLQPARLRHFAHGTTVGTNAVLERKGAKVGLITTEGFKDILEIGRQNRSSLYDLLYDKPEPLVTRDMRVGISQRINAQGETLREATAEEISETVNRLRQRGAESIAVCLLHSYLDPNHEARVAEVIRQVYPQAYISLSSEVLPEFREYERMSVTVLNAYLMPVMDRYLGKLEAELREMGVDTVLHVMQSNGGVASSKVACEKAVFEVLSGPAAGVIGASYLAQTTGYHNIISLDMGGTSCDVSLVKGGVPEVTTEGKVGEFPLRFPVIDVHTIGAGGGSMARVEMGVLLKVGPQSAGADPGPACYGKGGDQATVTDANVMLGRIDPNYFLGGEIKLDAKAAAEAISRNVVSKLDMDLIEAAHGIVAISNAHMVNAIRVVSVERGYDPRQFSLVAFGGAGPVQAGKLAEILGIPRVIIPELPGALSAFGLLVTDIKHDFVQTYLRRLDKVDLEKINFHYARLKMEGMKVLGEEGFAETEIRLVLTADVRYVGQAYEVNVPVPASMLSVEDLILIEKRFHDRHKQIYGHCAQEEPVEMVNLRVSTLGLMAKPPIKREALGDSDTRLALKGKRQASFDPEGGFIECPVYERTCLKPGNVVEGPAIIEQKDSTVIIYPRHRAYLDAYRNLIIDVSAGFRKETAGWTELIPSRLR
ncbi:MAG: hydantoinase/oxoprolinase family protein [Chloroflexi bacterium]|nr:hydantoinase/oxoprolinase family protein [Chloroflexota bacterium]MCL5075402.1 hydantoinase/oxoprolinase family protein [Chloroflexota bacterium]